MMSKSEILLYLQLNYRIGIIVCSLICICIYIGFSYFALCRLRKWGYRVYALAFVPVVNVALIVIGAIGMGMKKKKSKGKEEEFEL